MRSHSIPLVLFVVVLVSVCAPAIADVPIFGVLESTPARAATTKAAGVRLATVGLLWDRYEPRQGYFDTVYVAKVQSAIAAYRASGQNIVLDLGFQYTPRWVFDLPNSRFVDQYGDEFRAGEPGDDGANAVFNKQIREIQAEYVAHVFRDFGADFFAVRLGWGHYGELCYPFNKYGGHANCYWGYDAIAQGKAPGLVESLAPCPTPGWIPGTASAGHVDAEHFVNWYLDCMADYQNWQVRTVRKYYAGRLAVLYASWGVRPGRLDKAIAGDLGGQTQAEATGEIERGYDFARLVAKIDDPNVVVYSTWLDANFGDDTSADRERWNPMHYLAALAQAHRPALAVWGENTGSNDRDAMQRCFDRARLYHMIGINWAFEPQLYNTDNKYATLDDYRAMIDNALSASP